MTVTTGLSGIDELISSRAEYREGRPHIAGTGISVAGVAALWKHGLTTEAIAHEKAISLEQTCAALAYYLHNQAAIDRDLDQQERDYDEAMKAQNSARAVGDHRLG